MIHWQETPVGGEKVMVGSLFTGIGGFDLAFERAGATVAWQVEIDNACNRVLRRHWPEVPRFGDIQGVHVKQCQAKSLEGGDARGTLDPTIDVLVGGFP